MQNWVHDTAVQHIHPLRHRLEVDTLIAEVFHLIWGREMLTLYKGLGESVYPVELLHKDNELGQKVRLPIACS